MSPQSLIQCTVRAEFHVSYDCVMISPSSCGAWRPVWMCQIWTDDSHQLRICPVTGSISLTVKNSTHIDAQHSIQLYREKSREPDALARVSLHWTQISRKLFLCFLSIVELSKDCGYLMVIVYKRKDWEKTDNKHNREDQNTIFT